MPRSRSKRPDQNAPELELPLGIAVPDRPPTSVGPTPPDREERFFGKGRTPASQTKSKIVVDTFLGWAGVMLTQNPLTLWYMDLYCGPGVYKDGSPSTPLELFDKVVHHRQLPTLLRMRFNDRSVSEVETLREHLMNRPGYESLRYKPLISQGEVNDQMVAELEARRPRPFSFAFIDPFGYKGLTRDLIHALLQDFGNDILFFFAYQRIKGVLNNPKNELRSHADALFGPERVVALRECFNSTNDERIIETAIIGALADSMKDVGGHDVLPFAFRRQTGFASHHLAFVSKHRRGFQVAKEAMGRASSWRYEDDIPSLEFMTPGYERRLFSDDPPSISKLMLLIVRKLGGQEVSVRQAYDAVTFENPYVESNVRRALVRLVQEYGAAVRKDGQQAALRGSLLPHNARIVIPRALRRPEISPNVLRPQS